MGYQTEQELAVKYHQDLFLFDKKIKENTSSDLDIINELPGIVHLNRRKDIHVEYMNKKGQDYVRMTTSQIQEMGDKYLKKFCHKYTREKVVSEIRKFYSDEKEMRVFGYYQTVWCLEKEEWDIWYSLKKPIKNRDVFLTLSTPVENFGYLEDKMRRIVGEQKFVRDHYQKFQSLTPREVEILTLLAEGNNNPDIADLLFISRRTVEQHRKNLNRKLEIDSFVDIVKYAHAFDLINF